MAPLRPRLAVPFTILTEPDTVRLVAGEDFRYTLGLPGLDQWLPGLLDQCDGRRTADELVAAIDPSLREAAWGTLQHLYSERALVDGGASAAHRGARYDTRVDGTGPLCALVEAAVARGRGLVSPGSAAQPLLVFCQDRLDYQEALGQGADCRRRGTAFLWATTGPLSRAFVSPAFLPDNRPCFSCLYRQFHRLSPSPEIYDALLAHTAGGGAMTPIPFPKNGLDVVAALAAWKISLLEAPEPQAAPYRLHVLEAGTLEVAAYPVLRDAECPECGTGERTS
jgi:bacteriocin biosynthesis cyclodehydratase domain-containing protein